jgi:hypothetical protein
LRNFFRINAADVFSLLWHMHCWPDLNDFMARYSEKAQEKISDVMHELKKGKLKSGSGKKVTSRKQAIAIGISEAREEGAKVPSKKSAPKKSSKTETKTAKKSAGNKKTVGRPPKKATAKKAAVKKSTPGKSASKPSAGGKAKKTGRKRR